MRSRWARFFFSRSSTRALPILGLLVAGQAHATLTIRSLQSTATNDKLYFAGTATAGTALTPTSGQTTPAFPDPDGRFHFRVLNYDQAVGCGQGTCDLSAGI